MSDEIQTEVWEYSNAKSAALLVLVRIANNAANSTRESVTPVSELMKYTRLARRTVFYNVNKLEEMGEITVLGDRHTPATYRIREYTSWTDFGTWKKELVKSNIYPEDYQQPGNIKDPERQRAIQASRPRPRRKR